MILTAVLAMSIPVLAFIYVSTKILYRKRRDGEPPSVRGNWLWGNGADFSKNAVDFLLRCKRTYGNVFTIRLLHVRMTLLMDYKDYEGMSKERTFDFDPIQKQVNWNVFHFILKDPRRMMKETGKWVKGKSMVGNLKTFCDNLNIAFKSVQSYKSSADKYGEKLKGGWNDEGIKKTHGNLKDFGKISTGCPFMNKSIRNNNEDFTYMGLRIFASNTMFAAIFNTIFGFSDEKKFNSKKAFFNFDIFHKYFNYFWLGLPKLLFPEAAKALQHLLTFPEADELMSRKDLSPYIRNAIIYMRESGQNDGDIKGHNLVFLHVNYNTFRISFWILYYILSTEKAHEALMKEIDLLVEEKLDTEENALNLTLEDIESLEVLDSLVTESFRLSSGVFMVRHVTKDTVFTSNDGKTYLMRQGDKVAIYPPAIHKDEKVFEDPEEFKFDRFLKTKEAPTQAVLPFGSLCPGKKMAIIQTKIYVMATLLGFEIKLLKGEKAELDTRYYGHEILPPKKDVQIAYRPRPNPITVTMS